jgi:hypothetical protein
VLVKNDSGLVTSLVAAGKHEGKHWLFELDPSNGDVLWQCKYGLSSPGNALSVVPTGDGQFVFTGGFDSSGQMLVAKTAITPNDQCALEWTRVFGGQGGFSDKGHSIVKVSNGTGYVIVGHTYSHLPLGFADATIMKLDESGSPQWQKRISGTTGPLGYSSYNAKYHSVVEALDGNGDSDGFLAVGQLSYNRPPTMGIDYTSIVTRFNYDGIELWTRFYGYELPDELVNAWEVTQTSDGAFAIVGHSDISPPGPYLPDLWIIKIAEGLDEYGEIAVDIEWQRILNEEALLGPGVDVLSHGYSIDETTGGGLIVGGSFEAASPLPKDAWLLRTNEDGEVPPDCLIDLNFVPGTHYYTFQGCDGSETFEMDSEQTAEFPIPFDPPVEPECAPCVIRVNKNSPSFAPDGLTWDEAYPDLQDGIDEAFDLITIPGAPPGYCEVWVVQEDYYVYELNEDDTIQMRTGVHVFGGFSGGNPPADYGWEGSRDDRDWENNITRILGTEETDPTLKVYHVVTGAERSTLDGFRVGGGLANSTLPGLDRWGGGMVNFFVSPTVENCTFFGNTAWWGGGMANIFAAPEVVNCKFAEIDDDPPNGIAGSNLAIYGGGMLNTGWEIWTHQGAIVEDCVFNDNRAIYYGGGMYNETSPVTVVGATFDNNTATMGGGAHNNQYIDGWGAPWFEDCIFSNNKAVDSLGDPFLGGGMANSRSATAGGYAVNIVNGLFYANSGSTAPAIFSYREGGASGFSEEVVMRGCTIAGNICGSDNGGAVGMYDVHAHMFNTIIWVNDSDNCDHSIIVGGAVTPYVDPYVDYCDIWMEDSTSVWPGPGNINEDPDFYWSAFNLYWLNPTSQCIDTGADFYGMTFDIEGNPRWDITGVGDLGTLTDIGAYEYQP